ncbi:response regulator transcription factor [Clostridium sp. B9]|uniref:response regulator transcription factor n=1 Tax=Clostridium sp. B9 TaxID=3423224 RepID=UPI003D2F1E51
MFKVIIADDEKIVRIAMQNIIKWEEHGFTIVGLAQDGAEVLEILDVHGGDLVITDLKMKGLDGIELIEKLGERGFKGKILVLSNHGEYELVREAMKKGADDYLLKVTLRPKELEDIIDKFYSNLKDEKENEKIEVKFQNEFNKTKKLAKVSLIREYLKDEISYEELISNIDDWSEFKGFDEKHSAACICIDNHKKVYEDKIKDKNKLAVTIENIIREEFNRNKVNIIPINNHKYIFVSDLERRDLKLKTTNIQNLIKLYLNITVSAVITKEFNSLQSLKASFMNAEEILSLRFYEREGNLIFEDGFLGFNDAIKLKKEFVDVIEENIDAGEISANKDLIKDFIRRCSDINIKPKNLLNHVYFICELIENHEYVQEEDLSELKLLKRNILKSENKSELVNNAEIFIDYINRRYIKSKETNYKKEVNEIIDFIEKNIDKRITLVMVANAVNLNESYLSRIFKNETGKNLMYFINEAKMKKAKEMLKSPDNLIKEVANSIGMTDQFYFNRVFKKFYGVSPSKFKKDYSNKILT